MFRNLKKKIQKNYNWKKETNFKKSRYLSFIFAFYTFKLPNLQIVLEKISHI